MSEQTTTQPGAGEPISVNWQNVSIAKWQTHLEQLNQSYVAPEDRLYWMSAMRQWRQFHIVEDSQNRPVYREPDWPLETLPGVLLVMCEVAYSLCDWAVIIELHQLLDKLDRAVDGAQFEIESLQRAVAFWQIGQLHQARDFLKRCITEVSPQSPVVAFYQQIENDISRCSIAPHDCSDGDILLCPLEEQHLSAFSWVYNDPQIAKLCNLPEFADDEQWFDWLAAEQSNPAKAVFAVMHQQWGFIGSVSIEVHDGVGFIYYWLGQDFQGGGFGPKAVLLMLSVAEKHFGMRACYAKVFDYNLPSQKALSKLGFNPLPFKLAAPNQTQIYFYRGEEKSLQQLAPELERLMRFTDVDNRLETQLSI